MIFMLESVELIPEIFSFYWNFLLLIQDALWLDVNNQR
ncbi:hypothetical protein B0G62_12037 [Paraburkholderia eburnea]|uniref:Uncharacterized protein n=1 Tax=Paraburkholderia eburnea TaxID=1189126 RepID=A0A2S4LX64_9BURK|nr:hypothetical protein B0G62_12037 [Paraburkholderia eburnea]PRZ18274.1 hypothetical protein BX588_12037 [Paraburkholderia eburnea]